MFRKLCMILALGLLFAACQQQTQPPAPTLDTSLDNTAAESVQAATPANPTPQARTFSTDQPPLVPGTIIPSETEDALAVTPFDRLLFTRSGGLMGQTLTIEVFSDGTVIRDGVTSQINAEQVKMLNDALVRVGFFRLQGVFTSPGTGADTYAYQITVDRGGASRTINAEDGFTPPELMALFTVLGQLGAQ